MKGEIIRKINEAALAYGKKKKSEQSGYLHLFYHSKDDQPDLTIPLLENCLYAWSLLLSKTAEQIAEGKALLEKLLHFQTEKGFPTYLHEFPEVKDRVLCFHLFSCFEGILSSFHAVLGPDLKGKLEASKKRLFQNCEEALRDFSVPTHAQVRVAVIVQDAQWLKKLSENPKWLSPNDLGAMLAALLTYYPNLSDSPWSSFWEGLQKDWHAGTMSYQGKSKQEYQNGFEPQATLLDMVMGVVYEQVSKRSLSEGAHLLQAGYLTGIKISLPAVKTPFQITLDPFRCHWGSLERVHTLVCMGGNSRLIQATKQGNEVEMVFDLDPLPDTEDKERLREIVFYLDYAEAHAIRFNGASSNTFQMGDLIEIESHPLRGCLQFEVLEGSGQWMGHLMRGNRPNQIAAKGSNRFQSYDWQIILRTLRRTSPCKIGCRLMINLQ